MPLLGSSFARRTIGFLVAGLVVLLAIVGTSIWLAARTAQHADAAVSERKLRTLATNILLSALDAETGQRGYLLTQERSYLAPLERAKPQLARDLAEFRALVANDPRAAASVAEVSTILERKIAELGQTVDLANAGRREEALAMVRTNLGRNLMDRARTLMGPLIAESEAQVSLRLREVNRGAELLTVVAGAGALLILVFAGAASFTVIRYTRELVEARAELHQLNLGLEERVAQRTSALTRANEEIQRFAYIVSHDLRSPLVNIMGFTSELEAGMASVRPFVGGDAGFAGKAKLAVEADIPEAIGFIRSSTAKMDSLINAILKLSREGRRELRPEPIDLARLLENAAASLRHQTEEAGATIVLPTAVPSIVSDRLALEQVVGNVMDNAVKYLAIGRPGRIVVSARESAGRVLIAIADNGRGIAAQDHERVFELFRRAGKQDRPGEGIGLAHVRALVRRLGGDITVESELGQGTTFKIDLPRHLRIDESVAGA